MENHADQVHSTSLGGAKFDDSAKEIVEIHFAPGFSTDSKTSSFTIAKYLVIEELSLLCILRGRFG